MMKSFSAAASKPLKESVSSTAGVSQDLTPLHLHHDHLPPVLRNYHKARRHMLAQDWIGAENIELSDLN